MLSQKALRNRVLLELHQRTKGDLQQRVAMSDLANWLAMDIETLRVITQQLAASSLVWTKLEFVQLTVIGLEDAEQMQQSFYKRFADEYPFLHQFCWSILTAIATAGVLYWLGWKQ